MGIQKPSEDTEEKSTREKLDRLDSERDRVADSTSSPPQSSNRQGSGVPTQQRVEDR